MQSSTPDGIELDSSSTAVRISARYRSRFLLISGLCHSASSSTCSCRCHSPDDFCETAEKSRDQIISPRHVARQDDTFDSREALDQVVVLGVVSHVCDPLRRLLGLAGVI